MALQLNIKSQTKVISSTDEAFKDTSLQDAEFAFEITELSRKEKITLSKYIRDNFEDPSSMSVAEYQKIEFMHYVTSYQGVDILDENGTLIADEAFEAMGTTRDEVVYDRIPELLMKEIQKAIKVFTDGEQKKSETVESDLETTQIG